VSDGSQRRRPASRTTTSGARTPAAPRNPLFSALIGSAALVILLQAVSAGLFLEHDGKRNAASIWIELHNLGGNLAIILALAATVVGVLKLRPRRDLWIGSAVLTALLVSESGLGMAIRDNHLDALTAVHIPLSMIIMSIGVWLPMRVRRD